MTTPTEAGVAFRNQRRAAISRHPTQLGIDYVDVKPIAPAGGHTGMPLQWELWLYFIPADQTVAGTKKAIPQPTPELRQIRISGLTPLVSTNMQVEAVDTRGEEVLVVTLRSGRDTAQGVSDLPTYVLTMDGVQYLDPFFNHVRFSLALGKPSHFDSSVPLLETVPGPVGPEIPYLAKDYASFRQLMLNRLSVTMPQWVESSPADLGQALVDVLAYAADQLSYYQDAVATEAYLGTARRRTSVRRHARVLDYVMHEGCNARTWVQIKVASHAFPFCLPSQTPLLAGAGKPAVIHPESPDYQQATNQGTIVFETLHGIALYPTHNTLAIYTWGAPDFYLPAGSTQATLQDVMVDGQRQVALQRGDVLIFEEVKEPQTGQVIVDQTRRTRHHAVRLTGVHLTEDPLGGQLRQTRSTESALLVEITWGLADALPSDFVVSRQVGYATYDGISVARGNIVLADHGQTITSEGLVPPEAPALTPYRPQVPHNNLTYRVPYNHNQARTQPAAAATSQDVAAALPSITLTDATGQAWTARHDLLDSDHVERAFVVEMDNDRRATLRFGDGILGAAPPAGTRFTACYRIGNGLQGNVGRETMAHLATTVAPHLITRVRNLLPAQGGTEPEALDQVRTNASYAFRAQERCVIEADYAAVAERHPEVRQARASRQWTGSWHTVFVAVDRQGNKPVDDAFRQTLLAFMQPYLLADADLDIRPPRFVPLEIGLKVWITPEHFPSTVTQRLLEVFSNVDVPTGPRGFFHPDNIRFGQAIYQSQIVACARQIPGVVRVKVQRFQRWRQPDRGKLAQDCIAIGPLEIARLDNNPNAPEYGEMSFTISPEP